VRATATPIAAAASLLASLLASILAAGPARAACPCYSVSAVPNTYKCGVEAAAGTNPAVADWQPIFRKVAGGPAAWGPDGPAVADLDQGCGMPEPTHPVPATFPCELLQAIAMQESSWRQFCQPTAPANLAGPPDRTIIAVDCGYGVGQVTSGMHIGETPPFDRARVAAEPGYNLATGAQILADKWRATQCVGDAQLEIVEDWYTATWAYNGLAFSNNPNNPNYDAMRPVCDPNVSCAGRPYQERVWGWMEHPPSSAHWVPLAPAYPDRADLPQTGAMVPRLPEPGCAGPTDCTNRRPTHRTSCPPPLGDGGADGGMPGPQPRGCGCRLGGDGRGGERGAATRALALLLAAALCARLGRRRG
jgi:hypothetical protein